MLAWIPREPNTYRFTDEQMLDFYGACVRAGLPTADQAAQGLLDAWKLDINGAEGVLADLGAQLPAAVPVVRERAQKGHRGAAAVLAEWNVDDPSIAKAARQLADTVLAEPVGTVRSSYSIDNTAQQCAAFLLACSDEQTAQGPDESIEQLRERVAGHLLLWAEDHNDMADRSGSATRALSILAQELPASTRTGIFERLLVLYEAPGEHPTDAMERRLSTL